MRRVIVLLPAVLSAALLAACSDGEPAAAPTPSPVEGDVSASPAPVLEGPASQPHRYPDGLVVTLAKVERVPNKWGVDVPASQAIVRVTVEARNEGTAAVPVVPESRETTLLYGVNRTEAGSVTGYACEGPKDRQCLDSDEPERIAPGTSVTFVESALVPVDQLQPLTLRVELPTEVGLRDPYTFTDAQTVLKTVK